jgi:hypothetical protein
MKPIYIHKGDDTVFGNTTKFLVFKINPAEYLEGYKAEFKLRSVTKKIEYIENGEFEVILTAQETNKLDFGKCFGEIKLIDTNKRVKTICNTIPFVITPQVVGDQYDYLTLDIPNDSSYEISLEIGTSQSGGTTNYEDLENKPSINGIELKGNLTTEDLGISGGDIDTSNLVTKEELNNKGYLTEHQDLSHLVTKEEFDDVIGDIDALLNVINGEIV